MVLLGTGQRFVDLFGTVVGIMVAFKDNQAYAEYLVTFKLG